MADKVALKYEKEKVEAARKEVVDLSKYAEEIIEQLIQHICSDLDKYVGEITNYQKLNDVVPIDILLRYSNLIAGCIYAAGTRLEQVGLREDIAKALRQDRYNDIFNNHATGTVADKTAFAESQVTNETFVQSVYQRAYKQIKSRIEAAESVQQSLKKSSSARMIEMQVFRTENSM